MFTIQLIHDIVANEVNTPANLDNSYTPDVLQVVRDEWEQLSTTFILDDNLLSNCIRFRLANLRPTQELNYTPNLLGDHQNLIYFLKSCVYHHLRYDSFSINFSVSFIILDGESPRFVYHSQNYYCLEVAHQIHDDDSKNEFFNTVQNFNLAEYIL